MAIGKAPLSFVSEDLEQAKNIQDFQQRLLFLMERLRNFRQCADKKTVFGSTELYERIENKYEIEINYVRELIASKPQQNNNVSDKKKNNNCFNLGLTPNELKEMSNVLDTLQSGKGNRKLLPENITVPQFKKVFSGGFVEEKYKIEWIGSIPSLGYFIDEICKIRKRKTDWEAGCKCFLIAGKTFTTKNLQNNKKSAGKEDKQTITTAINFIQKLPGTTKQ